MNALRLGRLPATVTKLVAGAVAATAIGTGGCLTLAAPAHAYPPQGSECTQFGFKGPFVIKGYPRAQDDSYWTVSFDSNGTTATGPATLVFDSGEKFTGHVVSGGGIGGRNVNFRIQFDNKLNNFWDFSGTVNDKGDARGTEALVGADMPAYWTSPTRLDCLAPPLPLITGVPKADPPPPVQVPPPAAPTDAIKVVFARQGLSESVTITNTSDLIGKCTYVASPVNNPLLPTINRSFDIGAKGSAQLTVPAPPPFTTYHVVVSCRGTFNGKNVEFGHVEQDVS